MAAVVQLHQGKLDVIRRRCGRNLEVLDRRPRILPLHDDAVNCLGSQPSRLLCSKISKKQCIPETKRNMRPAPSPSCCGHTTHSTKHPHFDSLTPATDMRRTRHIQMQDKCLLKVMQNLFSGPKFGLCRRHSRHEQGRLTACPPNFTSKQLNFKHQEACGASELCAKR